MLRPGLRPPDVVILSFLCLALVVSAASAACQDKIYLMIATGNMAPAEDIARILRAHHVKAAFFMANEKTRRGDTSLDPSWAAFWHARASEGHAFGTHTWRHWYFRHDVGQDKVAYVSRNGEVEHLDQAGVCTELKRVDDAFFAMTGRHVDPLWTAPGGRTTARALALARACGYRHVQWTRAGFLGDELPSEQYPNQKLLEKALRTIRAGDILVMHLGIWSRQEPFHLVLEPLITGLQAKGLCFATLTE